MGVCDDPRGELERLVALYLRGRAEPLPFFPTASLAYAVAIAGGKSDEDARGKAEKTFTPRDGVPGGQDGGEPHVVRVLAGRDPFEADFRLVPYGPTFAEIALSVFGPMLRARRDP